MTQFMKNVPISLFKLKEKTDKNCHTEILSL
jgi:hypothetical protein